MNPWISQPTSEEPLPSAPAAAPQAQATGPSAPQRGVPAPDQVDQLPVYDRPQAAPLWWVGTHGGAGESTLASLVPEWPVAQHGWPRHGQVPARVVLVARTSERGLRAAQAAATQWAAGLVPHAKVVGLVLMADAPGKLPKPLRDFAQVVSGGVPRMWTVPWIERLRLGESLTLPDAPREVRRLVDELSALLAPGASRTGN